MVLIKNVTTTSKGYQYLKAQHYKILTKVVDEITQTFFLVTQQIIKCSTCIERGKSISIFCIIQ
jgi:hypothetical protein